MWSATKTINASGFGILAIFFDGGEFFFVRAAAKKILHPAHEENLKWRHQRGSAGAIKNFGQIVFREIELEQAEVTEIGRNQMFENGVAKTLAEKSLIANKHISRTQLPRLKFADKAFGLGKSPHETVVGR